MLTDHKIKNNKKSCQTLSNALVVVNSTLGPTLANVLGVVNNGVGIAVVIGCTTTAQTGSVIIVLG